MIHNRVILFTTSNWSKRTITALRKIFEEKGIDVEEDFFYAQAFKAESRIKEAKQFGERI